MTEERDRIDYDYEGNLYAVTLGDVEMFRIWYMNNRTLEISVIRKDGTEDVFCLSSGKEIKGHHERGPAGLSHNYQENSE